jgi:hypothetical protein
MKKGEETAAQVAVVMGVAIVILVLAVAEAPAI